MIDSTKLFRHYVWTYNRLAAADGRTLYRGTTEPIRQSLYLRDLFSKRGINRMLKAARYATPEQEATFRAEFFERIVREDGDLLELGFKFKKGRRPNTGSPIRKKIAALLRKQPTMRNLALWGAIKDKPPKRWAALDNRRGKYLEGPQNKAMSYERFCNVAAEERAKAKITG